MMLYYKIRINVAFTNEIRSYPERETEENIRKEKHLVKKKKKENDI